MQQDESFFGFETRLPRDMEPPSARASTETLREQQGLLGDAFGELRLDELERRSGSSYNPRSSGASVRDPWASASSELNSIDNREIFSDLHNPQPQQQSSSSYGVRDLGVRSIGGLEPVSSSSHAWQTATSPNFFGEKGDVEDGIPVDLSGLMDDTDSFNSVHNRQEFFNEFTKQTYLPYTPREEPMSMETTSKESSPWGSTAGPFSAFGGSGTWSTAAADEPPTRQVSIDQKPENSREDILSTISRQVPSVVPNVVRTPMTLEELEREFMPAPVQPVVPSTQQTPHHDGVRSPFRQPTNGPAFHHFQSPVPQSMSPDRRGVPPPLPPPSPFGMMDPNNFRHQSPRPLPPGFIPIPGRMPLPGGMPGGRGFPGPPPPMRFPYPQQPPLRGFDPTRGPHPGQFMPIRAFNGMPIRGVGGLGGPMIPPQMLHHMQQQQMGPGFRGPRPLYGQPLRMLPPQQQRHMMSQVFVNQRYMHDNNNNDADYDDDQEVAGWMTEREKDWVIKVQQSQVRTDNPYMDDYYYYVRSLKKATKDASKGLDNFTEQDFILPARMASDQKEERFPANNFEGSLGKVCISSVFNPRKTVDVDAVNIAKNRAPPSNQKRRWFVDPLQKEKGHPKALLLGIEDLYKLVLELQDFSREVAALPEGQREQGIETRRNIINLIFDRLIQGTTPDVRIRSFCDTVKIRKGRELLRRVLPILFKEQLIILTGYCVRALPVLMDVPSDKLEGFDRCLVSVEGSLRDLPLKRLVEMLSPLIDTQHNLVNTAYTGQTLLSQAVKNQFALHFLSIFLARAEDCYDAEWSALSDAEREKWTLLVTYLFISLTKAQAADVACCPSEALREAVSQHIARFPFSPDAVAACRAKLGVKE
ncbi:putative Protein PAT1-like protein 1 [Hypsibius exemplaris]|uniref:Protein PAT1-like protein 1 n=1 Tax=Hypsibius exemplaris TaxID=2072580 RepID=A0A1W0WLH0_HYPEX|nr:putative Protein PAT1-like protein 1 [Hypsibius exemplaris]